MTLVHASTEDRLIDEIYSAFNRRDITAALAHMSEHVSWPRASEGGRVVGKDAIRAYWSRQWQEFNPHVDPLQVVNRGAGRLEVRVHQLVKNLAGETISDTEVLHTYTTSNGLVDRMDLEEAASGSPSAAFSGRKVD